jgi:predicted XRE-type DNA-binding protein
MMKRDVTVTKSSGNVFADLGFANAEEELLKARIVLSLRRIIEDAGLTQKEAAERMGVSQPDVSKLLRGRVTGFSLERLFEFVRALGNDIEIRIKKTRSRQNGKVRLLEVA